MTVLERGTPVHLASPLLLPLLWGGDGGVVGEGGGGGGGWRGGGGAPHGGRRGGGRGVVCRPSPGQVFRAQDGQLLSCLGSSCVVQSPGVVKAQGVV